MIGNTARPERTAARVAVTFGIVAFGVVALSAAGCGGSRLTASGPRLAPDIPDAAYSRTRSGLEFMAIVGSWNHSPHHLADELTIIEVVLTNETGDDVLVSLDDFSLQDEFGYDAYLYDPAEAARFAARYDVDDPGARNHSWAALGASPTGHAEGPLRALEGADVTTTVELAQHQPRRRVYTTRPPSRTYHRRSTTYRSRRVYHHGYPYSRYRYYHHGPYYHPYYGYRPHGGLSLYVGVPIEHRVYYGHRAYYYPHASYHDHYGVGADHLPHYQARAGAVYRYALREGTLPAGSRTAGYLYFERMDGAQQITVRWRPRPHDPEAEGDAEEPVGTEPIADLHAEFVRVTR